MIRKRSTKRAKQEREYAKRRIEFLETNDQCALGICSFRPCGGPLTVHHKRGRSGDMLLDEKYWLPVCLDHHEYIEKHPTWAKVMGYSLSRLAQ